MARASWRAGLAPPLPAPTNMKRSAAWAWCVPRAAVHFWKNNVPGMAATIAFFAFLSLVPLLILLLAFAGDIAGTLLPAADVRRLFQNLVPGLSQQQFLHTYWDPVRHSHVATRVLGVISLLLGTLGLHDAVDWAVNRIWRSPTSRPFWVGKLRGLGIIAWVVAFALFSLWLTWLWVGVLGIAHVRAFEGAWWVVLVPSLVLDAGVFAALYKLTPTVVVRPLPAALAGIVGAGLWEVSKIIFGIWVVEVSTYNRVYGPLAASIIVMLWLWISAMIFLFGAELCATMHDRHTVAPPP